MNYLTFAERLFRTVFRNRSLTFINIAGLAVGLAVSMFLLTYLNFEFSYDRQFKDSGRIYRMLSVWGKDAVPNVGGNCLWDLAGTLKTDVPEIEEVSRLFQGGSLITEKNQKQLSLSYYMVDSSFLHMFDFDLVFGNLDQALFEPGECVISRVAAERLWGAGINPVGQNITEKSGQNHRVMAVIDVPDNTHFKFDVLIKLSDIWGKGLDYYTYIRLHEEVDVDAALNKCNEVNRQLLAKRFQGSGAQVSSLVEPLTAIHLKTQVLRDLSPMTDWRNLFFIGLVVCFILGIAVCNFISLYVIQGEGRAKEIGIRKTSGAGKKGIIRMIFAETCLITTVAFAFAFILYNTCFVSLCRLINLNMPHNMGITVETCSYFALLFVFVTFISGIYPAYYLSRFDPMKLIRSTTVRKYRLTTASVIVQFSVVVFCISSLLIFGRQLKYIINMPLGYNAENVFAVYVNQGIEGNGFGGLRSELMSCLDIEDVVLGEGTPAGGYSGQVIRKSGQSEQEDMPINESRINAGYFDVFHIPLLQGKDFSGVSETDAQEIILSETAAKVLGVEEVAGQKLIYRGQECTVIGIVGDTRHSSARKKTEPLVYSAYLPRHYGIFIRYKGENYTKVKEDVLTILDKHNIESFSTELVKDAVVSKYGNDRITGRILLSGTILTIVLALMGLLALTGFVVRQKRKEIGVRRVLGAQGREIVFDLNRYIIIRILPAVPVGIALSWWVMARWLNGFEYALIITWWIFALALLVTLVVVLLTVFYQTVQAAVANPVDALKSE